MFCFGSVNEVAPVNTTGGLVNASQGKSMVRSGVSGQIQTGYGSMVTGSGHRVNHET
ncbi:hypothetical protein HanRHA438_Chr06g0272051 [Helianthus annuus]|uniref:Uncharacterized protein n=1 Tax=Helianthus annuus TaxID=4232 RepID=A0A251ULL6_HELAN|nr:hypothetical protein HanXRQr2_Chr06g0262791 [Helianthus annuus]KAJ0560808.1 hypothetical protein HanHA300_Chr06g0215581 [Helianthus annuus]KAJ0567238.1 hypothetical protein HanIR_Chr06g0282551 [Helianthus annuus]KAJ0573844.1 hypothetical protein HanHA89_Chr06g0231351 [Helianthus annuus]KAJ0738179.1 hypothetical protein HanLR1_Chr06g0215281 [Helianthus annuus]